MVISLWDWTYKIYELVDYLAGIYRVDPMLSLGKVAIPASENIE